MIKILCLIVSVITKIIRINFIHAFNLKLVWVWSLEIMRIIYVKYDIGGLVNRPFSKMAAKNSNRSILKTYTCTRKDTFTFSKVPCQVSALQV